MRVLFVTAEAYPLAKTGGLADVSRALPLALARHGVGFHERLADRADCRYQRPGLGWPRPHGRRKIDILSLGAQIDLRLSAGRAHHRRRHANTPQRGSFEVHVFD